MRAFPWAALLLAMGAVAILYGVLTDLIVDFRDRREIVGTKLLTLLGLVIILLAFIV